MGFFDSAPKSAVAATPQIPSDGKGFLYTDCAHVALGGDVLGIEFGLWLDGSGNDGRPRPVLFVVMNLFTAKRLHGALAASVERHEQVFGEIRMGASAPQGKLGSSQLHAHYLNFVRVTGTPEEVILDFGVNPQPTGPPKEVVVSHKLVMTFPTMKRLHDSLGRVIGDFEARCGRLETDIEARAKAKGR
ncbi:MAG TPA: DUF3467 domain-containing protein [Pirellulaceae bacterium]|nr:DUF3467 domain-containing protein [Pirellulaceae bacterium]